MLECIDEKSLDFGDYLRKQRMLRGVSHDEIVNVTKVRLHFLDALEKNKFEVLPPKTFVVGFLRAVSRYLGLDEEDVVMRFLMALQQHENAKEETVKEIEVQKTRLKGKSPLRFLAWFGGVLLVFFLI
ncbi:MAG: helix-turn-helix domain-containing protein, partial [Bdellovibrionales bacterium]|nr:helix-turn-helix domain-containing protein [Bdellovibrionales bacterium]